MSCRVAKRAWNILGNRDLAVIYWKMISESDVRSFIVNDIERIWNQSIGDDLDRIYVHGTIGTAVAVSWNTSFASCNISAGLSMSI